MFEIANILLEIYKHLDRRVHKGNVLGGADPNLPTKKTSLTQNLPIKKAFLAFRPRLALHNGVLKICRQVNIVGLKHRRPETVIQLNFEPESEPYYLSSTALAEATFGVEIQEEQMFW